MNIEGFLTAVAVSATGGIIAILAGFYLFKNEIRGMLRPAPGQTPVAAAADHKEERLQMLPLRLQAHERLILFIERINPANLFVRLHQQGIPLPALQSLVLNEIRSEFQHNVAQQLYVSPTIWAVICKLKDDTLAMVSNAAKSLPEGAEGVDLSKKVLQHMAEISDNPYDLTQGLIKKDIQQLF
ncbi:DUF7935 family protein [Pedobacter frigoris]|uniref:Uncharacterized protein n=1 Tax=Pedobacter frigoris TaxID=2571272 RepID=A0A4U1CCA8_9SPHI|nr:hypothetical protein [Pedobacter frigoris]TKC02797.1 hypothetical protein FA047_20195 [Pedobacter frigoris]